MTVTYTLNWRIIWTTIPGMVAIHRYLRTCTLELIYT